MTQYGFTLHLSENEMAVLLQMLQLHSLGDGRPEAIDTLRDKVHKQLAPLLGRGQQEQPDHGTED